MGRSEYSLAGERSVVAKKLGVTNPRFARWRATLVALRPGPVNRFDISRVITIEESINMEIRKLGATIAATVLALIAPAATMAAPAQTSAIQSYSTTLNAWNYGGANWPYPGTLKLQIWPNGIVSGWYSNYYDTSLIPVVGGEQGQHIWLDIGQNGELRISAHMQNGKLVGTAIEGDQFYDFAGNPIS